MPSRPAATLSRVVGMDIVTDAEMKYVIMIGYPTFRSLLKVWFVSKRTGVVGVFNSQGAGWCKVKKKIRIHDVSPSTLTCSVQAADVDVIAQAADPDRNGGTVVYLQRSACAESQIASSFAMPASFATVPSLHGSLPLLSADKLSTGTRSVASPGFTILSKESLGSASASHLAVCMVEDKFSSSRVPPILLQPTLYILLAERVPLGVHPESLMCSLWSPECRCYAFELNDPLPHPHTGYARIKRRKLDLGPGERTLAKSMEFYEEQEKLHQKHLSQSAQLLHNLPSLTLFLHSLSP
ncbi:hypothetical protein RJ639_032836 [Escallonia herrerae]|uniref:Uncharacterized protein n=1 Tax=Escallonia herrerae TaxID=1293975 RepID=A0AA88WW16_9ASTE|nr:hypothetical protein RJ639_032836 [Escallonia herrerae]